MPVVNTMPGIEWIAIDHSGLYRQSGVSLSIPSHTLNPDTSILKAPSLSFYSPWMAQPGTSSAWHSLHLISHLLPLAISFSKHHSKIIPFRKLPPLPPPSWLRSQAPWTHFFFMCSKFLTSRQIAVIHVLYSTQYFSNFCICDNIKSWEISYGNLGFWQLLKNWKRWQNGQHQPKWSVNWSLWGHGCSSLPYFPLLPVGDTQPSQFLPHQTQRWELGCS